MFKARLRINLFWKILLLFWLIFVIIFSFNRLIINLSDNNIRYRPLAPHLHKQIDKSRVRLMSALKKKPQLKQSKNKILERVYLIDTQGHDYFSKPVPDILSQLNREVIKNNTPLAAFKKQEFYFGGLPFLKGGETYKVYLAKNFSLLNRSYLGVLAREFSRSLLASTFLISFPISFLLAWFFTRPIKKLQLAIKELSENITERKNLTPLLKRRDEFGDLAKDFDSMAVHLDQIISSKSQLLSDVSHELKSPLARLQIALALADKKHQNADTTELARIKLEANRMNQMISSLLDYSKMNVRCTEQEKKFFDLGELIELLVNDASYESQQKHITIETDIQNNIQVKAVKPMLISCIENILRNAIRYATSKITISCQIDHRLNQDPKSEQILIKICDDGCGIQEDQKEQIFEAFYRPETDRSRQSGGVGLGLSIAKKVTDAHNGKICAENIPPHGLKVSIFLPAR